MNRRLALTFFLLAAGTVVLIGCGNGNEVTIETEAALPEESIDGEMSPRDVFLAMNEATFAGDKSGVLACVAPDTHSMLEEFLETLTPESGAALANHMENVEMHDGVEVGDVAVIAKSDCSDLYLDSDLKAKLLFEPSADIDPIFFRKIQGVWKMIPIDGPPTERYFSNLGLTDSFTKAAAWYTDNAPLIKAEVTERVKAATE